jgi:hypothetical protein
MRGYWSRLFSVSITVGLLTLHAPHTSGQPFPDVTVDFGDPSSLRVLPDSAAATFARTYTEHGMTFTPGVVPPDPRLGQRGCTYNNLGPHFHLAYEDPSIVFGYDREAFTTKFEFGREVTRDGKTVFVPVDPALESRSLQPHRGECIVQMTFNRNVGSALDRFDFISLEVHDQKLNLGVRFSSGAIGVANNLTEGFTWGIVGANDLTRATLERAFPPDAPLIWKVDDIVFKPLPSSPAPTATAGGLGDGDIETIKRPLVEEIPDEVFAPSFHEFLHRVASTRPCRGARPVRKGTTPGDDVIRGTGGRDVIDAGEGNDIICGGDNRDRIIGGAGIDLLIGGRGNDEILGGADSDDLRGGFGNDFLDARDDVLNNDVNDGGVGTDTCLGDSQDSPIRCERLSAAS